VQSGATLAPGASAGTFHTGNVTFNAGATFALELGGAGAGQFDQLAVTGGVTLGGATLSVAFINSFNAGGSFTIIDNDGTADGVSGQFAQGSQFSVGNTSYAINYAGGDGNDVVLTVTIVPPLSTTPTPGNDSLTGTDGPDTIAALESDDIVRGLGAGDLLFGNQGNDTVHGGLGNDTIWGGLGNDIVNGNEDNDLLFGNEGLDTIDGGEGNNTIVGGQDSSDAADSILAGGGADLIWGNGGADTILADGGANTVIGGFGKDSIVTGSAGDIVFGNQDNDTIDAGDGGNLIFGGFGDDSVTTGSGNDTIWGNEGNDSLAGAAGADRYVFLSGSGNDQVNDFAFAEGDRLDLQGQTFTTGASGDGDVVLLLSGGGTIELNGIAPAGFSPGFVT
jgi:Ca2+-binding RTX toxin-like protein